MALDRQKILSDLGNIVNQLQSADCGCLGKVFSNPGQGNPTPLSPQYPGGCCQGGYGYQGGYQYNSPCAGEPCPGGHRRMGCCNPTKLFADTYNYLKPNLMQPVVQEVYNDLKSITPQNTVMNNPMAAQMGLSAGARKPGQGHPMAQNAMPGGPIGNANAQHMHGHTHNMPHLHFGNLDVSSVNPSNPNNIQGLGQMNQGMGQMGQGMGQMGQGMGQMGQSGREINHMGHGMDHMTHGMDHMGHGINHMAHGVNHIGHMGHGVGHMGHGMGHTAQMNQEMGQIGHEGGQMGQGMGQMGQEMGQMEQGMGQMGQGMGQMGQSMGQIEQGMGQGMGPGIVQEMGHMHSGEKIPGMGPQIVNMMHSSKANYQQNQGGPPPNVAGMQQPPEMGQMPGEANQGQYHPGHMHNAGYMSGNNMPQGDPGLHGNQLMTQPNINPAAAANTQGNAMAGDMKQMNPRSQPMGHNYGAHNAGVSKFNEMFSGMMKGDLGFDPMAIAIQMNPANEKNSAITTMQKMMMGDSRQPHQMANSPPANLTAGLNEMMSTPAQQQQPGEPTGRPQMQNNQQVYQAQADAHPMKQQTPQQQINAQDQQMQQQQWQQSQQQSQEPVEQAPPEGYQRQQIADTDSEAVAGRTLPTVYEGYPNIRPTHAHTVQHMYREPIFPADTSRHLIQSHHFTKPQRFFDFNTLGQPVEMLPAKRYRTPIPDLPQTLSPEPNAVRYSNVRSTISKTALMGNKPEGNTPSRTQLQNVYNQYKGSQSFTQQNIRPSHHPSSYSVGHINVTQDHRHPHPPHQAHIEKTGGDTVANNRIFVKMDPHIDQIAAKKADFLPAGKVLNSRNGLQDQVFRSPPTSAKWSFHGTGNAPFSTGYRYTTK